MTRQSFAGGHYDFDKFKMSDAAIVEFGRRKWPQEIFVRFDDGSEDVIKPPYEIEARTGHRIRYVEHDDIGWIGHRLFELRTYYIMRERLYKTIERPDLPPHGNSIPRFLIVWVVVAFLATGAAMGLETERVTKTLPVTLIEAAYVGLLLVWFVTDLLASFRRGGVEKPFREKLVEAVRQMLYAG